MGGGVALTFCFLTLGSSFGQITVSTNSTWDPGNPPPSGYENGITLNPAIVLTINNITLEMNPGSIILVNQNSSRLILNNATITSDDPTNNNLWDGIRVIGNNLLDQYLTFPDPTILNNTTAWEGVLNSTMPRVEILNNTIITHAQIGVFSEAGGIVRAKDSKFLDNAIGIKISMYEHPDKIVGTQLINGEFINACQIFNSIFEWTKDNPNINNYFKKGIYLEDVNGIAVGVCYFANNHKDINNDFVPYCYHLRGTGMYAANASLLATTSGNSFCYDNMGCLKNCEGGNSGTGNTFENLTYGVVSTGGRRRSTSCVITNSTFNNNFNSINAELFPSSDYSTLRVIDNSFSGDRSVLETLIIDDDGLCGLGFSDIHVTDISVKNAVSSDIYNNIFYYNGINITHILIDDIGTYTPRIINNTFTNSNSATIASDNVFGVRVIGSNPKLIVSCNIFTDMGTDIKIHEGATVKSPMSDKKGNAAYNTFSDILLGRLRIDNSGNSNIEYLVENKVSFDNFHPFSSPTSINVTADEDNNPERDPEDCQLTCSELVTDNFLSVYSHNTKLIKYNLYPNPATGLITFESENEFVNNYSVYSVTGKIVTSWQAMGQIFAFDTDNYASGIYYISIHFENGSQLNLKFIVQK